MAQTETPGVALMRLVRGYQVSQAIHAAAALCIADLLKDGPRPVAEIARQAGTDPDATYRMLRALATVGIFAEGPDRTFSQTPMSELLRADHPETAKGWAEFIGEDYYWDAWGNLLLGVRNGENVFPQLHGTDVWAYRASRPEASTLFDRAMTSMSRMALRAILAAYDFSRFPLIVDVGGGNGALLAAILGANPAASGIVFDQPHVVSAELLKAAGIKNRCEVVGGSFFESVPEGGDAYILKAIIHDWPDDKSVDILRTVRRAMKPGAKLLVIEQVVGAPNEGPRTKFSDLNMLVMPGGRERTQEEFAELLSKAGFRQERVASAAPDTWCVIEGVPV